ncbi:MAG TPA: neutral zinc metallopeptidase [Terracidiphilus sp.]
MDWTPGGMSNDVEDRRGESGGFGMGGGGIGIIGFIILLLISLFTGHNFIGSMLHGGATGNDATNAPAPAAPASPAENRDVQLISFVLDDAQKTWTQIFAAHHRTYRHAKLVLFRGATYSGCGTAQATTGPFYCPEDEKVYIDLRFWNELKRFGGDTGDFAQAYVITHELGHHVQKLLGIEGRERQLVEGNPEEQNVLSVDLELQADCFAGVWGHTTEQRNMVHPDDVAGALRAAAAVGDDHLQRMSGRAVSPESWTHGSSAQRERWFRQGLEAGQVSNCSTFDGRLAP